LIITQPKEEIGDFVAKRTSVHYLPSNYTAIAKKDEKGVVVGWIYNGFITDNSRKIVDCQIHVAARENTKWATKDFLFHAFSYPFDQIGCNRITALIKEKNKMALKTCIRLGFKKEGLLREAQDGENLVVLGMLKKECKWI